MSPSVAYSCKNTWLFVNSRQTIQHLSTRRLTGRSPNQQCCLVRVPMDNGLALGRSPKDGHSVPYKQSGVQLDIPCLMLHKYGDHRLREVAFKTNVHPLTGN